MAQAAIVLASASPRRRQLLTEAGLDFEVCPADVDESLRGAPSPEEAAEQLADRKARASRSGNATDRAQWFVGADTIVAVPEDGGWRLLGKAADAAEARRMLESLSGTTHRVVTGVCVAPTHSPLLVASRTTHVTMRALTEAEIDDYVASGEWRDKAGAYAIQETADRFVTELTNGGFDNVVGLPVDLTLELLRQAGAPLPDGAGGGR